MIGSWLRRRAGLGLGVVWVLGLAGQTFQQTNVWASDEALWTHATTVTPGKARGWVNLGTAYAQAGRYWDAEIAFYAAEQIVANPQRPVRERQITMRLTNLNLAQLAMLRQDWQAAWPRVEAVRETPWTSDRASVAAHRAMAERLHAQLLHVCGRPCDETF